MAEDSGVAAVDRALSLMACFRPDDYSLTLTEMARRTGLYKSTALRLIESLLKANFLYRLADGTYQIGVAPFQLGALYQRQFKTSEYVPPVLREIAKELGESASYYVYEQGQRLCLHRVEASNQIIRDAVREGDLRPLTGGATGTVLLAFRGEPGAEMDKVRRQYWAASFGGSHPEMAAVAVPVFKVNQELAGALSVSGPRYRFEEKGAESMVPALTQAAAHLTRLLGGDASVFG
jgi:DNA-binding IclR family transcriptional regulator